MIRVLGAVCLLVVVQAAAAQSLFRDTRTCGTVMKSCEQFCANNLQRHGCMPDCEQANAVCNETGVFRTQHAAVPVADPPKRTRPTRVDRACCIGQAARCDAFCRTPEGIAQGSACPEACRRFVTFCEKTGQYVWRGGRTVMCRAD